MSYNRFPNGAVVEINGAAYWAQGYSAGRLAFVHQITGDHFRCVQADGSMGLPTDRHFEELLAGGDAVIRSADAISLRGMNEVAEWTQDQSVRRDREAARRAAICRLLDDAGVPKGDAAIENYLAAHWTAELAAEYGPCPSSRTIRHWYSKRGRPGFRHPRHMVRLNAATGNSHTDSVEGQLLWMKVLAGAKRGLSPKAIHSDLAAEVALINSGQHPSIDPHELPLKMVSQRTVRRRFDSLRSSLTLPSVIEQEAQKQDWLGAGKSLTADFVMQRVIIDHTEIDAHVICPKLEMVLGRPWLTIAIDVKSRAIVGHVITFFAPCNWTVGEILRRIVLPKRPPRALAERYPILTSLRGKPTEIIVDNATEFRSLTMEAAARHAGFSVRFCPIKQPRYRAMCERVIGTINRQLCEGLPGRTLSLQDARRWGYNAEQHAVVMLDELEAFMNHLVAVYNVEPHEGIGKRPPALVFEKDVNRFGINNFADFESFRRDTMQIQESAQLSPSGIRAFGSLRYHGAHEVLELLNDLVPLEPRRRARDDATATVDFRFDPMDISRIYVWNRKTRKYVALRCSDERYADGMPLWLHDRIREAAKTEGEGFNTEDERLEARGRLVQAIRAINPGDLAASRKRMAELLDIPRIRQITGNIVHLIDAESASVSLDDFIANDRAALTSLDLEILAPRPAPRPKTSTRNSRRRYEDARQAQEDADVVPKRARRPVQKGGYK